jgi:hypothetical protein
MRPHLSYVLAALLVISTFPACKKESHPPSSPNSITIALAPTVYVLGVQDWTSAPA